MYAGGNVGNGGTVHAESRPWHGYPFSAPVVLPPLATVWLEAPTG
jgi:1,4-alpha-glucan branching enzyme